MTAQEILNIEMQENDAGAKTIGGYVAELACQVIVETEGFSGKRAFGNSGWYRELVEPLVRAGAVKGRINEWGDVEGYDYNEVNAVLVGAIREMLCK